MAKATMSILPTSLSYLLLALTAPASAGNYYVASGGSDLSDCLTPLTPCRTADKAVRKMASGIHNLTFAPGIYSETVNVTHGRQVSVQGPRANDGSCPDATMVTLDAVSIQDNATAWVNCLTIKTVGCRQWSIGDIGNVVFNGEGDVALVANETCRLNTAGNIWIDANVTAFASASNYSTIYIGGPVYVIKPNLTLAYFVRAEDSTINLSSATFFGYPLISGLRFTLDHGIILFPSGGAGMIPGVGSAAKNFSICRPCD